MLYLLDKLVIALIAIAGMGTLVGDAAAASAFALFLSLLLFLGSGFLGFIATGAIDGLTVGHLAAAVGVLFKVLHVVHVYMEHLFPGAFKGTSAVGFSRSSECTLMHLIGRCPRL